jgi:hypothetical protein
MARVRTACRPLDVGGLGSTLISHIHDDVPPMLAERAMDEITTTLVESPSVYFTLAGA